MLEESAFKEWAKRDFTAFIRGCERFGRTDLVNITKELDGSKTEEQVREYAAVFWERYRELDEWEKHIKTIERGESRIQRNQDIMSALARKVSKYKNPVNELKIHYGPNKGKAFTEEEDRYLVCAVHELGYGRWEELKSEIRRTWRFRFDWFLKSRSPNELQRRTDTLIRLIEKELEEIDGVRRPRADGEVGRKRGGGRGGGWGGGRKRVKTDVGDE